MACQVGTSAMPQRIATASTGDTVGVRGRTASADGVGVFGEATASSGETYGMRATTASICGVMSRAIPYRPMIRPRGS